MRVIDAHVHLYPPETGREPSAWAAARGEPHWAALGTRRRKDGKPVQGFPSVDQLLRDMDAAGVSQAVLLGWYWENHATCVEQNKFYAECIRAHPDRLIAFATAQPSAGSAAFEEVCRAVGDGLNGLGEFSPHAQHFSIDDPVWRQIMVLAAELKVPVNLHVTDPASRKYPGRVETPLEDFVRLVQEFPATRFILAHCGGGPTFAQILGAFPNVWFDTAAAPLIYEPAVFRQMLTALPASKVIYGSDYPLILYPQTETAPGFAGFLNEFKTAGASSAVLGGNVVGLIGLG
ncbi:MAG: amidohydrolase [Lacunisphaera sp.]|nr:amidohydrolase [Lacunisphaera sp.]